MLFLLMRRVPVSYSLKLINPSRKTEYVVHKLHSLSERCESIEELKQSVIESCEDVPSSLETFGYIQPGHGAKGKQRWLISEKDLIDIYKCHGNKEILLWCYRKSQTSDADKRSKRPCSPSSRLSLKNHDHPCTIISYLK